MFINKIFSAFEETNLSEHQSQEKRLGHPLFKNIQEQLILKLTKTKTFRAGHVMLYYERIKD